MPEYPVLRTFAKVYPMDNVLFSSPSEQRRGAKPYVAAKGANVWSAAKARKSAAARSFIHTCLRTRGHNHKYD